MSNLLLIYLFTAIYSNGFVKNPPIAPAKNAADPIWILECSLTGGPSNISSIGSY